MTKNHKINIWSAFFYTVKFFLPMMIFLPNPLAKTIEAEVKEVSV